MTQLIALHNNQPDGLGVLIIGVDTAVTDESTDGWCSAAWWCDIDDELLPLSEDNVAVVVGGGEQSTSRISVYTMTSDNYEKLIASMNLGAMFE